MESTDKLRDMFGNEYEQLTLFSFLEPNPPPRSTVHSTEFRAEYVKQLQVETHGKQVIGYVRTVLQTTHFDHSPNVLVNLILWQSSTTTIETLSLNEKYHNPIRLTQIPIIVFQQAESAKQMCWRSEAHRMLFWDFIKRKEETK